VAVHGITVTGIMHCHCTGVIAARRYRRGTARGYELCSHDRPYDNDWRLNHRPTSKVRTMVDASVPPELSGTMQLIPACVRPDAVSIHQNYFRTSRVGSEAVRSASNHFIRGWITGRFQSGFRARGALG
jgi:hypothetical protein